MLVQAGDHVFEYVGSEVRLDRGDAPFFVVHHASGPFAQRKSATASMAS